MEKTLTCESFVIEDLLKSREEIKNLKKENEELRIEIEKINIENRKELFNKSGVYFEILETSYESDFKKLLNKTSYRKIRDAITLANNGDYEYLDEIRKIELSYSTYIGIIVPHDFTHLINHGGYKFIVNIGACGNSNFNIYSRFINNKRCFLDKDLAEKEARRIAIENLKKYIEWFDKNNKEE